MTMATLSFPSPVTQEQRDGLHHSGRIPLPERLSTYRRFGWSTKAWIRGPQKLPDGREVENALILQQWHKPEHEDTSAGEELEIRQRWMSDVKSRLGLLAISVERYDIYYLY
jgi:hypothetical protein